MTFYVTSPATAIEARRRMMRQLIDDSFDTERVLTIPMDLMSNENEYLISALLPGLSSEEVNIQFNNGTLTIDGEYQDNHKEGFGVHLSELPIGRFSRSIEFNDPVEPEKIEAEMKNGILTVRIPKTEEAKPKTIKVIS
ncbi:MAG: hypothetical protein C0401_07845, partial [Anaerolinea sp.]|nr:hypothetical protein [Anaerolinea sp.]